MPVLHKIGFLQHEQNLTTDGRHFPWAGHTLRDACGYSLTWIYLGRWRNTALAESAVLLHVLSRLGDFNRPPRNGAFFSNAKREVYVIPTRGGNLRTRWSYHRFSLHSPVHEMRWYNLPSLALQTLLL